MHTSKDDYLINSLRFVSAKESSQIYGVVLLECLTSPEMKESHAYKTYLGHATGVVPPKIARKFKKASPSKKDSILVQADEEPVQKGKQVKRSTKKSSTTPAVGIVFRETLVKTKSTGKEKSTTTVTCEDGDKPKGSRNVTEDDCTESESESWGNDKDDNNNKQEASNNGSGQENESEEQEFDSEQDEESDNEDKGMDDTTDQFEDDVDARLEEPTQTGKEVVQGEGADNSFLHFDSSRITTLEKEVAEIKKDPLHTQVTSLVDEHLDTRLGETREEFMNFLSESLTTRIKEQVKDQLPQILPKEVSNFAPPVIKKLIKESRNEVTLAKVSSQPQSTYEAASTLTEFELKKILLDKMEINKDKDEDPSAGSDRGLKKRKLSKDAELTTRPKKKDSTSGSSKGTKSQPKSSGKSVQSDEPVFEVADSDLPQDQKGNLGDNEDEPRNETASRRPTKNWLMTLAALTSTDKSLKDFDELMSTPIDFSGYILNGLKIENLSQEILLGPAFRLLKGIHSNYAELEYDFEECYKALSKKLDWKILKAYLQGGISTMTYTTSTTKTKATKYDLPGIEDMVQNIWSPVKVAYDRYVLWGISHWREQCKSFYAYARGMQSRGDVYSTKHILAVSHVKVMRKHRYGYFEKIVLRRADNVLYRFKEGDFPQLQINDIEDMLILVKRVEDLQLGVKSYQKKINVTKPDTTRPDLRKRHPYTPYKDI
ncbi:hypothetical protein Tco_1377108 [Tanacetum coccineum]